MSTTAADSLIESHEYDGEELVRRATLERRNYERKSVAIRANVSVAGMSVLPGHIVDMSRVGASITVPFDLAHGQQCLIDLELEACGDISEFHIQAEVRYCVPIGDGRVPCGFAVRGNRCSDLRAHRGHLKNSRLNPGLGPRPRSIPIAEMPARRPRSYG